MALITITWFIILLVGSKVQAAQHAIVVKSKAIIYADKALSSPLGYVKKGKKILVGDVPRYHGDEVIFTIIVSEEVAYIKANDLRLQNSTKENIKKSRYQRSYEKYKKLKKPKDDITKNNYLNFYTGLDSLGKDWKSLTSYLGEKRDKRWRSVQLTFEHHPTNAKTPWFWNISMALYYLRQSMATIRTLTLEGKFLYSMKKLKYFTLDFFIGPILSGDIRLTLDGYQQYRGYLYGVQLGAQLRFFPQSKFGFVTGMSYKTLKIGELDGIYLPPPLPQTPSMGINKISGLNFYGGLSYKY